MTGWLRIAFIAVYLLLAGIQCRLFYSIYSFEKTQLDEGITLALREVKTRIEAFETGRRKDLFEAYKNEYLCGQTYAGKPLELTFVIAPTDSFTNLKELSDIIKHKLHRQAVASSAYQLEKLPLGTVQMDSVVRSAFRNFNPALNVSYTISDSVTGSPLTNEYRTVLFDDYRLYHPQYLSVHVGGTRTILIGNLALIFSGTLLAMILLTIATRYAYLSMMRYKTISENKAEFISHLTHEIRTPLTSIYVASQALTDERVRPDRDAVNLYAQIIFTESERLNRQLENVLSVSAAEKNFLTLVRQPLDVHALIESIVPIFRQRIREHGGELVTELQAAVHTCNADKLHLGNALYNLLDNAVKYSPPDHIRLRVETLRKADELIIRISDEGKGIPQDDLQNIFNMFYKREGQIGGFGVGLHYARRIIADHGGTISAESRPGKGSAFTISLPLHKS